MAQVARTTASAPPTVEAPFPALLIKAGLVFSEAVPLSELLCKPKLLPLRGAALERLEQLDESIMAQRRAADEAAKQQQAQHDDYRGDVPLIAETFVPTLQFTGSVGDSSQ